MCIHNPQPPVAHGSSNCASTPSTCEPVFPSGTSAKVSDTWRRVVASALRACKSRAAHLSSNVVGDISVSTVIPHRCRCGADDSLPGHSATKIQDTATWARTCRDPRLRCRRVCALFLEAARHTARWSMPVIGPGRHGSVGNGVEPKSRGRSGSCRDPGACPEPGSR